MTVPRLTSARAISRSPRRAEGSSIFECKATPEPGNVAIGGNRRAGPCAAPRSIVSPAMAPAWPRVPVPMIITLASACHFVGSVAQSA